MRRRLSASALRSGRLGERGMALLVVLWAVAGMALLVVGLTRTATGEARRASVDLAATRARMAVDAGFARAVAGLRDDDPRTRWLPDGTIRRMSFEDAEIAIRVEDEAGRIDLNGAEPDLLRSLLEHVGASSEQVQAVTDAIADWRDGDRERSLYGAEASEYEAAGRPERPADAPFATVGELRAVLPMTPDLFRRLEPNLTVFTGASTVDPLWAPVTVLESLPGVTASQVDQIRTERRKSPPPQFSDIAQLLPDANAVIAQPQRPLVRITVDATVPPGVRRTATIVATLDDNAEQARTDPRFAVVLDWRDEIGEPLR